jgi:outer membrane lipoprotein-sorting protein
MSPPGDAQDVRAEFPDQDGIGMWFAKGTLIMQKTLTVLALLGMLTLGAAEASAASRLQKRDGSCTTAGTAARQQKRDGSCTTAGTAARQQKRDGSCKP